MKDAGVYLLAAATAALAPLARGQNFPDKPIRLVVAYGGGVDFGGRTLAQRLIETLKQPVVAENRTGASGSLGVDLVAKARADGHTLLLASPAEVIVGPAAGQKSPYNAEVAFAPMALAGETPLLVVVHPSLPASSLPELIAHAKSQPGKQNYATQGNGNSMHLAGESLNKAGGTSIVHFPYRGAAPAVNDLLGNQVEMAIVSMPQIVAHAESGKLKVLAVTTPKRSPAMPDVATVSETPSMKDYRFSNWMGVFAPARAPQPAVERLGAEIASIVREPQIRERLLGAGVEPSGLHGAGFAEFLAGERRRYQSIAKESGIRFDKQ